MGMGSSPSRSGSRATMSEINVTPFVDVMLVLLIIFMVTAPMMQQGIEVNLPKTAASGVEVSEDPFVLNIDSRGILTVSKIQVPINQLHEKLKAIFATRKKKQIYISADSKVDYGIVAETMAEVRRAGISNINLMTQAKD